MKLKLAVLVFSTFAAAIPQTLPQHKAGDRPVVPCDPDMCRIMHVGCPPNCV